MERNMREYHWIDGKSLVVGKKTLVMGILNFTSDSFSDGGCWNTVEKALNHAREMIADGADIIDLGVESSRPGFTPIPASEEIGRLSHILKPLLKMSSVPVSVDTFKAETAAYALRAGAHIINDIWGLQYADEPGRMAEVIAPYTAPVIVMHNQKSTNYTSIIDEMKGFFSVSARIAAGAGINERRLIMDPGIGFGKTARQNIYVLRHLHELTMLPYPVLLGASRKSFIGRILKKDVTDRLEETCAVCVAGALAGCDIVRVHDVRPVVRMCRMADVLSEKNPLQEPLDDD